MQGTVLILHLQNNCDNLDISVYTFENRVLNIFRSWRKADIKYVQCVRHYQLSIYGSYFSSDEISFKDFNSVTVNTAPQWILFKHSL